MKKKLIMTLCILSINAKTAKNPKSKQCIVCVCQSCEKVIISDPFCNYENPTLGIHKFTCREIEQKTADNLCKKICAQKNAEHKATKIWRQGNHKM